MLIVTLLHPQDRTPVRQWRFEQEKIVRIGRAPGNQVIINDPVVSRFHLELHQMDSPAAPDQSSPVPSWDLINFSVNGTFLDGQAIAQTRVTQTTLVQLAKGGPLLQFQALSPVTKETAKSAPAPLAPEPTEPLSASSQRGSAGFLAPGLFPEASPTRCTHSGNPPENLFCIHCGQPVWVEKVIRQYQVLRVLGRGGMGTTFLVWNPAGVPRPVGPPQGRLQVLKEMNADIAQIPKAQELFEREASTLKLLNHPGIPRYYDYFIEDGKKYLVMELVHGLDLEKRVRRQGLVPPRQAVEWMIQTCEILNYLHSRPTPIIHRDIKPGNLLVRNLDQRIVVLDFGAVKAVGAPTGTRIGAEGYSAPEQVQGRPVIQSDLYAIGASLIFLLAGKSPQRFLQPAGRKYRLNVEGVNMIPEPIQALIMKTTAPEASDRYQSAKELIRALRGCL
jgi:serine/threonine protein kinase, bacterial